MAMLPASVIDETILLLGTTYKNIIVIDMAMDCHVARYDAKEKTFTDLSTGQIIEDPVMWDDLPRFSESVFNAELEEIERRRINQQN